MVRTMSIKEIFKKEFKGFKPSGSAWDMMDSKNMLSRNIAGIISDAEVVHTSINLGNKGKFVWINKADGTHVSGNIENDDIWRDFPLIGFDKVNYDKITFGFIPVDDF